LHYSILCSGEAELQNKRGRYIQTRRSGGVACAFKSITIFIFVFRLSGSCQLPTICITLPTPRLIRPRPVTSVQAEVSHAYLPCIAAGTLWESPLVHVHSARQSKTLSCYFLAATNRLPRGPVIIPCAPGELLLLRATTATLDKPTKCPTTHARSRSTSRRSVSACLADHDLRAHRLRQATPNTRARE
jgi:hypothetical protein